LEKVEYLSLAEFLLVAEVATGVPAETLARLPNLGLSESALAAPAASFGGVDFYPDFVDKAAVLCARIARNHSLRTATSGRRSSVSSSSSSATAVPGRTVSATPMSPWP
jgi:hypothetical protein